MGFIMIQHPDMTRPPQSWPGNGPLIFLPKNLPGVIKRPCNIAFNYNRVSLILRMNLVLTKSQARKIILHAAGLSKRAQFGKGREAVYKLIDHLGFVQVDTNYVVERAHHHAIATRVPDYRSEWLEELQA